MINLNDLTKNVVIACGSNDELASYIGLSSEDTTIGMNGYPENTCEAIVSDSLQELEEVANRLKELGFEVSYLELHKKDGWHLWNRKDIGFFEKGMYMQSNDSDYTFEYDHEWSEEQAKKEIYEFFFGSREEKIEEIKQRYGVDKLKEALEALDELVQDLYDEMRNKKATFHFIDMDNICIDYSVDSDSTGYYEDTNHYQLAIMVEFPEEIETFREIAEEMLNDYVQECIDKGNLTQEWFDNSYLDEYISDKNCLCLNDRIQISSTEDSDTRYSVYYNSDESLLNVVDTSA